MKKIICLILCLWLISDGIHAAAQELQHNGSEETAVQNIEITGEVHFSGSVPDDFQKKLIVRVGSNFEIINKQTFLTEDNGYKAEMELTAGRYVVSATIQNTYSNADFDILCSSNEIYVNEEKPAEVVLTVTPHVSGEDTKSQGKPQESSVLPEASDAGEEMDVALVKEDAEKATSVLPIVVMALAIILLISALLQKNYKLAGAVVMVLILLGVIAIRMDRKDNAGRSEKEEIHITEGKVSPDIPETEDPYWNAAENSEETKSVPLYEPQIQVGNSILTSVYIGTDTAYGYYGYFGASNKAAYEIDCQIKEEDTNEAAGYDTTTGLAVYESEDGKYYTYSDVTQIFYDENNHLPDDRRDNLRDGNGYWIPNCSREEDFKVLQAAFSQGQEILAGTAQWSPGSIVCNGILVPGARYYEKEGDMLLPVESLDGYFPYDIQVTETDIIIQYPGSVSKIPLPQEQEETWEYVFRGGFGYGSFQFEADYPELIDGSWYVEVETLSRIAGIDIKYGDGLICAFSGEKDLPKEVRYIPWSSMDYQQFTEVYSAEEE